MKSSTPADKSRALLIWCPMGFECHKLAPWLSDMEGLRHVYRTLVLMTLGIICWLNLDFSTKGLKKILGRWDSFPSHATNPVLSSNQYAFAFLTPLPPSLRKTRVTGSCLGQKTCLHGLHDLLCRTVQSVYCPTTLWPLTLVVTSEWTVFDSNLLGLDVHALPHLRCDAIRFGDPTEVKCGDSG